MNKKLIVPHSEFMTRVIILIFTPVILGVVIPLFCRLTDDWLSSTFLFLFPITLLWSLWLWSVWTGFLMNTLIPGVKSCDVGSPVGFWMIFRVVVTVVNLVLFGLFKLIF